MSDFKAMVGQLDGKRLETAVKRRPFVVRIGPYGLEYTPEVSGHPRPDTWDRISSVIDRHNETGSWNAGDYQDLTRHASYVLAILARVGNANGSVAMPAPTAVDPMAGSAPVSEPELQRPHQRVGAVSNAHVGRDFEQVALEYFRTLGIELERNFPVQVGLTTKKVRRFDLGTSDGQVLVECKSHRWTSGGRVPSAKMTVWNEAMFYFFLAPTGFRKCFFVLHDKRAGSGESLVDYYRRTYAHLIPADVEFFEWDESSGDLIAS